MRYAITKTYHFSAAHVLCLPYASPCNRLHGHNYEVTVELARHMLDNTGMVYDYTFLDAATNPIIKVLDHKFMVSDKQVGIGKGAEGLVSVETNDGFIALPITHIVELDAIYNTTAEEIARWIWVELKERIPIDTSLKVTVKETPKTSASYEGPNPS